MGLAIEAHRKARIRRVVAEHQELDALRRVIFNGQDEGLSYRQLEHLTGVSRPTLGRHALSEFIGRDVPPSPFYDEDEWIAASDSTRSHELTGAEDRGPWVVQDDSDGTRHTTTFTAGIVSAAQPGDEDRAPEPMPRELNYEPWRGITSSEHEHLMQEGLGGERAQRIVRRLARAVLRVLHPGMPRFGIILDAAIDGVRADIGGAMVLTGQAVPTTERDEGWVEDLRGRRAGGFYLPKWGDA